MEYRLRRRDGAYRWILDRGSPLRDPEIEWAQKAVREWKVDLICLKLLGPDPLGKNLPADHAAKIVKAILEATDVPLIIWGCGDEKKDNEVLPACSQAARGENCLLGPATHKNYWTLAAIGKADKHKLIGEAPVDINIAKQINILLQDAGFNLNDVVMCHVTAALGYGYDYVYTIFERVRAAGLKGDKHMALPQIANVGWESWKVKEAIADDDVLPGWGKLAQRGPRWGATTAAGYIQAGADILTLAHPEAIAGTGICWQRPDLLISALSSSAPTKGGSSWGGTSKAIIL